MQFSCIRTEFLETGLQGLLIFHKIMSPCVILKTKYFICVLWAHMFQVIAATIQIM